MQTRDKNEAQTKGRNVNHTLKVWPHKVFPQVLLGCYPRVFTCAVSVDDGVRELYRAQQTLS